MTIDYIQWAVTFSLGGLAGFAATMTAISWKLTRNRRKPTGILYREHCSVCHRRLEISRRESRCVCGHPAYYHEAYKGKCEAVGCECRYLYPAKAHNVK